MTELGYALSSEEHPPSQLVRFARRAEETGFRFAFISDHFHPWIDRQGQSPFVWAVLGAIAESTEHIRIGTGVTCPLIRTHPAIIAQAAATCGVMLPGRFMLGLGTGENLNEHITGERWPPIDVRLEMLSEAIEVIRLLWQGGTRSFRGRHYTVEDACIYTLPAKLPPLVIAAGGEKAATIAGAQGDGLVGTGPDGDLLDTFHAAGGDGKPRYGQVSVCYAEDEDEAVQTALEWWPNAAIPGQLTQELAQPAFMEMAAERVRPDDITERVACGPDPERHLDFIRRYADAGYEHVYIHQVGPDQEGFFRFYEQHVLPKV